jgi:hypothetical protein
MIFPDQGGVVVVTGAMGDGTYHDLPDMLRHAFRAAFDPEGHHLADDAGRDRAAEAVRRQVADARMPETPDPSPHREGFAATYDFDSNAQGLRSLAVDVRTDSVQVVLEDERGRHTVEHGVGHWVKQETGASVWRLHHSYQDPSALILATAEWSTGAADVLHLTWHFLEAPFIDRFTLTLGTDGISVVRQVNVNSGSTGLPAVHGRLRRTVAADDGALVEGDAAGA